ncbi:uncharacterized protein LOC144148722 [Haemaphysalis longicornis]
MDPAMTSSDEEEISPRRKRNAQDNEEITPPHKRSKWEMVDGGEEDVTTSGTGREDEGSSEEDSGFEMMYDEEEDEDAEHSSEDYDTKLSSEEDSEDEITREPLELEQGRGIRQRKGQGEASDAQTECGEASDAQTECGKASNAQTECGEASSAQTRGEASDAQAECCAICLEQFQGEEVGMPECCDHVFCLVCIQEWAKVTNKCPLDKEQFSLILVRKGDQVVDTVPAPAPRKAKRKEEDQAQEEGEEEDLTECEICGRNGREGRMLRCAACDLGYHCECLSPPLYSEPAEEWYCPHCATSESE